MNVVGWMERRFGRFAVPRLTALIVAGQVAGFFTYHANPDAITGWTLVGEHVLRGELWRLVLFPFIPPGTGLLTAFAIYIFYLMGSALEATWGDFRFNLYLLIAYLSTVATALLIPSAPIASNGYIGASVFLAFAWLFPEFEILLFFILPVRVKWLAWITWAGMLYSVATGSLLNAVLISASVLNFLMFFGGEVVGMAVRGRRRMERQTVGMRRKPRTAFHRCAVCSETEVTAPEREFRFCSQCGGEWEYCDRHLRDHEHRSVPPSEA